MNFYQLVKDMKHHILFIIKWLGLSLIIGCVCGVIGAAFSICIEKVTSFRLSHSWVIALLPFGGMLIVYLYRLTKLDNEPGTNTIIQSVRQQEKIPILLAPAIFLATIITHLLGGSSGREGAALQLGGSLATTFGKMLKVNQKEMSIFIMCGMSAVFSALFGLPLTATLFSMEVISVGIFYYAAFVPCLCSSLVSLEIAKFLGCHGESFPLRQSLQLSVPVFLKLIVFSFIIAGVSIMFVMMLHYSHHIFQKYFQNRYQRVIVGSFILMILTFFFGKNYLGAGMNIVENALYDHVYPYDFFLKALFTAITIGCGFKGGEIVPTFFIGATLGYTISFFVNLDPHICAALGLVGMFCCVINTPITSLVLGIELFGTHSLLSFACVVAFCYVLSGYFSLYQAQKIMYSKTSPEFINQNANEFH